MDNLAILGSTGSIGCSAIEVVRAFPHRFQVYALAAGRNVELLCRQVEEFRPEIVGLEREEDAREFRQSCSIPNLTVVFGQAGAEEISRSPDVDTVISAITGIKGLRPTLAAVTAGRKVALANKESMVVAGELIQRLAHDHDAEILPIDSEHSGVFQCLAGEAAENIKKVFLTASGGPFYRLSPKEMETKSPEEALDHPRWKMGKKVTIDSATMMNKGLELIEAKWLFGLAPRQLEVLIHPQSIVHSLVEMQDGSVIAQLSQTDMRIPIQYALTYPERQISSLPPLDLSRIQSLEFYDVEEHKFPLFKLAVQGLSETQAFSVVLNASNELAVEAFLEKKISFADIYRIVAETLEAHGQPEIRGVEDIFEVDREARERAHGILNQRT
jgi:1-deoxy-D-xylulose-5-phosphate reductoisomerase